MKAQFSTAAQAKDFLIGKIVAQAQLEGVPLSEAERKMMYYSVEERTVADEVADQFSDEDLAYEKKISALLRHARKIDADKQSFKSALAKLAQGDHYLSVMAFPGRSSPGSVLGVGAPWLSLSGNPLSYQLEQVVSVLRDPAVTKPLKDRSPRDVFYLLVTALALVGFTLLFGIYWEPAKEAFWHWLAHITGK